MNTIENITINQIFADVEDLSMCITKAENSTIVTPHFRFIITNC